MFALSSVHDRMGKRHILVGTLLVHSREEAWKVAVLSRKAKEERRLPNAPCIAEWNQHTGSYLSFLEPQYFQEKLVSYASGSSNRSGKILV